MPNRPPCQPRTPTVSRRPGRQLLLLASVAVWAAWLASPAAGQRRDDYAQARAELVETVRDAVRHPGVLKAIGDTERHLFVPVSLRDKAYFDMALPIGASATISPPAVVGFMTAQLDPQPSDRVLEIGTGSGYQAAILSPLVAEVYSIEIVESLGRTAAERLRRLGYENVHTKVGDGFAGWKEHAPFDKIIVTCSPDKIPQPLVDQLKEGGMMVIPLGTRFQQSLCLVRKQGGELKREVLESTFFIPMTGRAEELRDQQEDDGRPAIANGGFEKLTDRDVPYGWYYLRQYQIVADGKSPEGERRLSLHSDSADRAAQCLQATGVDGRRFRELEVSLSVKRSDIVLSPAQDDFCGLRIFFYDERRKNIGAEAMGPWRGSSDWTVEKAVFRVPGKAKLAVISTGLFGATGTLEIDNVRLEPVER